MSLLGKTNQLGGLWDIHEASVGGKLTHNRIPARIRLTPEFLLLVGYYIAEGNSQKRYIILANRKESVGNSMQCSAIV
jgi:hypothetical protein